MLTVTLLGTAATLPRPDRALSAAVFTCQGRHILLDCGEGTQVALHRLRISPMKIDLIALTHYHGDHILGLPGLLQTMGTLNRTQELVICGPEGLEAVMQAILFLADELPFPVRLMTLPPEGLTLSALNGQWPAGALLTAFPTLHRVPAQGYRFHLPRLRRLDRDRAEASGVPRRFWRMLQSGQTVQVEGRTIHPDAVCEPERPGLTAVFTGDTAPCEAVVRAARKADLLIMDTTYADDALADKAAFYGHSTFRQTAELAAEAGVKRLWLTHFSAMLECPADALPTAQEVFPGAICGMDGMREMLTFPEETDEANPCL